jgi:cytochrome c-type biogenesis protein CcmE
VAVTTPSRSGASRRRVWLGTVVILGALGFLVSRGLGDATLYFRTADEAVAQKAKLGNRRFRLEGVVVDGSVREVRDAVTFRVEQNGATVPVRHRGDPPELFRPNIAVVLEGRFDGDTFASDRIMVKHSEQYREKHPDRVQQPAG